MLLKMPSNTQSINLIVFHTGADKESTISIYIVGTDVQVVCLIATTVLIWDKPCTCMGSLGVDLY